MSKQHSRPESSSRGRRSAPGYRRVGGVAATARAALAGAAVVLGVGACTTGARSGRPFVPLAERLETPREAVGADLNDRPDPSEPVIDTAVVLEDRHVGKIREADLAEMRRAWRLFVRKDPAWPEARDRWIAMGGAAPYVLAENLLRYFVSASAFGDRRDLSWIAVSAKKIGEPAVGYFGGMLVLDRKPLDRPVRIRGKDGSSKVLDVWVNDDVTRQQLCGILAHVGEPAVRTLSSDAYLRRSSPNARRYVMYALGRIGSDRAVDALAPMLGAADWQDRATAAKSLGLAIAYAKNERARAPLQAALSDRDPFVRKKAEEGLEGKSRLDF